MNAHHRVIHVSVSLIPGSLSSWAAAWLLLGAAGVPAQVLAQGLDAPRAYPHADLDVDKPSALAFSPNNRFLGVGDRDGRIFIFDVEAGRAIQQMRPARSRVVGLAFSQDGSSIIVATEDKRLVEVDLLSGEIGRTQRTDKKIRSFDVSPDGRVVVVAGDDGMVEILNSRFMRQEVLESPNLYKKKVVFSAFGVGGSEVFAASDDDGRSAFWELGQDDPIRVGELVREEYKAFARDAAGQLLALGIKAISLNRGAATGGAIQASAAHSVRILDWTRGRVVREIEELPDEILALAISPDRALVVIAMRNGDLDAYSTLETRRVMAIHQGERVGQVSFSPSGGWLAAGMSGGGVRLWEVSGVAAPTESSNVVTDGDVLSQSAKYEFTTGREPLITSFDRFTMAVLDLDNLGIDADLAATVSNLVVSRLANSPFINLVERGAINQVLDELKLQNTGITSARDAAEIGRLLNTQNVLLGNVNKLGSAMTIALRLVETESARVLGAREIMCRNCQPEDLPRAITLLISSLIAIP